MEKPINFDNCILILRDNDTKTALSENGEVHFVFDGDIDFKLMEQIVEFANVMFNEGVNFGRYVQTIPDENCKGTKNKNILLAIMDKGITQRELAKRSGVHETRLSLMVNNRLVPSQNEAARLSRALGTKLADLFQRVS